MQKNPKLLIVPALALLALTSCGPKPESTSTSTSTDTSTSSYVVPENAANGVFNYGAASYEEKAKILGLLEKYALNNYLSGIPLYDDASLVKYSSRLSGLADKYIPNYGFGVGKATITAPMEAETNVNHKMHYHSALASEPGQLNYMNDKGSTVGDLHGYWNSAYYDIEMNETKDGYNWVKSLAAEEPKPLNMSNGMATKWRIKLKTGDEVKYDIVSSDPARQAFKGRAVKLEDYITPFKAMLDNQWARATDISTGSGGFVGASAYLTKVQAGQQPDWSLVSGIQMNEAENALDFEFLLPKTPFYAKYSLASSLFSPIPQEFLDLVTPEKYATYSVDGRVDNQLSLGMYVLSEWEQNVQIVFDKSQTYFDKDKATMAGYKFLRIDTSTNTEAIFNAYQAGQLDSCGIPNTQLAAHKNDPDVRKTLGDIIWKMQVNSATPERWAELFGQNGTVGQHKTSEYWDCKPLMSNRNFLDGLYLSIDRATIAMKNASNPAMGFLSEAYMIDPEQGVSFRNHAEGKGVLKDRFPLSFGYNTQVAKEKFKLAIDEEVAAGRLVKGTASNPTVLKLVTWFQATSQFNTDGEDLKNAWEGTFNTVDPGVQIELDMKATSDYMDCYNAMMNGEYDFGFGSISGNTLDPISFMDVLRDDNRTTFTLSWGASTSLAYEDIQYDGKSWSYNALQSAAAGGVVVRDGAEAPILTPLGYEVKPGTKDGTAKIVCYFDTIYVEGQCEVKVDHVGWYIGTEFDVEFTSELDKETGLLTVTIDNIDSSIDSDLEYLAGYVCVYYTQTVSGIPTSDLENDIYVQELFPTK